MKYFVIAAILIGSITCGYGYTFVGGIIIGFGLYFVWK